MGLNYYHPSTLPRLRHVVWCRVPTDDKVLTPGATVRPALVLASSRDPATNRSALMVAYGTTQLNSTKRGGVDLIIQNSARLAQLDLPHAVRFNLDFANWLPWAEEFFAPPQHTPHVIAGALSEPETARLRQRLARRGKMLTL